MGLHRSAPVCPPEDTSHVDYPAVVWLHNDDDVRAYLCVDVELQPGWALVWTDAWLGPCFDDTGQPMDSNEKAWFEAMTRVAVPAGRVRFIEWNSEVSDDPKDGARRPQVHTGDAAHGRRAAALLPVDGQRVAGDRMSTANDRSNSRRPELLAAAATLNLWASAVERDLHEPDKILCHIASMRRAALDYRLDAEQENE